MAVSDPLAHGHDHETHTGVSANERRTRIVIAITCIVMVAEIGVGRWTGSLALTADGWHMATHAGALGLSALAYWFARTHAERETFAFGTGKVYALAGFTSAVLLAVAAVWMGVEAVSRLISPTAVRFDEALPVAVLGLVVNLICIRLLHGGESDGQSNHVHVHVHDHDHDHVDGHGHGHSHGHDHNMRAVYLHVLADALTSVFAIGALICGRYLGWVALDPMMAIVGGVLILRWSIQLGRDAGAQLVDATSDPHVEQRIRAAIAGLGNTEIIDLHSWQVGPQRRAAIVVICSDRPQATLDVRAAILAAVRIDHLTIETHCREPAPAEA
ncbi:MAG TPA: CDF family Co(II)/Ni(II) efflux transporter DmeF [Nannocystaceae bacterium]|nr:CDF family Co(II)/Ni(II) efflux transporter DmeF [Nannocystaceae bacterium]